MYCTLFYLYCSPRQSSTAAGWWISCFHFLRLVDKLVNCWVCWWLQLAGCLFVWLVGWLVFTFGQATKTTQSVDKKHGFLDMKNQADGLVAGLGTISLCLGSYMVNWALSSNKNILCSLSMKFFYSIVVWYFLLYKGKHWLQYTVKYL